MHDGPDGRADGRPFELLASDVRLGIVRVLGESMAGGEHSPLSFSELQTAVGVEDNGRFNYHLDLLTDRFVEKRAEGYRLRPAGIRVFQAVESGSYDAGVEVAPGTIDAPCLTCDGRLSIWYAEGRAWVGCRECDDVSLHYPLPPNVFDRDDHASLAAALSQRLSLDYRSFLRGVCPYCSGDVSASLAWEKAEAITDELADEREVFGRYTCERCYWFVQFSPEVALHEHPALVAFFYERGLDVEDIDYWNQPYEFDVAVRGEDSVELAVSYTYDGDTRALVVDDELRVVAVEDD